MKIFLATTSIEEIRWGTACGLADGALVATDALEGDFSGATAVTRALEIARRFPCPVFVSHTSRDADELYREARDGARASDQLVFDFPFGLETIEAMRRAVDDGARVAASGIVSAAQALLAAKAGADWVFLHLGTLDAQGADAATSLRDVRAIFDAQQVECDIVALYPGSAARLTTCARAGVDAVVMRHDVLRALLASNPGDASSDPFAGAGARARSFR
jgi:transaldolase